MKDRWRFILLGALLGGVGLNVTELKFWIVMVPFAIADTLMKMRE